MKNRLIQFHGSSSFHSLSQNIPFYQSTTTPLKPYLGKGICKISHSIALYNSPIIRTESGKNKTVAHKKPKLLLLSFLFVHFFKQQVSEHTRIFSDGHKEHFNCFSTALSWPGIIPRNLQNFPIESGVFIYSYLCREGTILNFWNLNVMSNPYVWPPDNEDDWIILKCQWRLMKFRENQGYETLVLPLLRACEVVA